MWGQHEAGPSTSHPRAKPPKLKEAEGKRAEKKAFKSFTRGVKNLGANQFKSTTHSPTTFAPFSPNPENPIHSQQPPASPLSPVLHYIIRPDPLSISWCGADNPTCKIRCLCKTFQKFSLFFLLFLLNRVRVHPGSRTLHQTRVSSLY